MQHCGSLMQGRGRNAIRRAGARRGGVIFGFSLIELLCVIAIILILVSMLLPVVFRTFKRVREFAEECDAGDVQNWIEHQSRGYCAGNPRYSFDDKLDFANKVPLNPKCWDWIQKKNTEFVPFTYMTSTNVTVLTFHYGKNQASVMALSKGDLTITPQR
jgi:prepilin-type N-terminal cleavage/methylation domain-containing protein